MNTPNGTNVEGPPSSPSGGEWQHPRTLIAFLILGCSILGVIILGGLMIYFVTDRGDAARYVLASILPMVGTWVGTVLAFYYSKDNFESATRSAKELLGVDAKLAQVRALDVCIPPSEMLHEKNDDDGKIVLKAQIERIDDAKKGQRLPVLSGTGAPRRVVHRSIMTDYLASKALAGTSKVDLEKLTLADLVKDSPELARLIGSFGTVSQAATLAQAKRAMDREPHTQDVFLTTNGTATGEVLGWITNVVLDEHSKV